MAATKKAASKKQAAAKQPKTVAVLRSVVDPDYVLAAEAVQAPIVDDAKALDVTDQVTMDRAGLILTDIVKPMMDEIHKTLDPVCDAANKAHKAATTARGNLLEPYVKVKALLGKKVAEFLDAEDRRVQAEQNELDRVHREMRASEDRACREAQEAGEQIARRAEHDRLAGQGDFEAAELALSGKNKAEDSWEDAFPEERPEPEPAPVARASVAAPKGVSTSKRWRVEITDPGALIMAISEGKAPMSIVQWDNKKLVDLARSLDGKMNYPGVRAYKVAATSVR